MLTKKERVHQSGVVVKGEVKLKDEEDYAQAKANLKRAADRGMENDGPSEPAMKAMKAMKVQPITDKMTPAEKKAAEANTTKLDWIKAARKSVKALGEKENSLNQLQKQMTSVDGMPKRLLDQIGKMITKCATPNII